MILTTLKNALMTAVRIMQKYWVYVFILILGLIVSVSLMAIFTQKQPETKTVVQPGQSIITRSAVDSTAFVQQNQYTIRQEQPKEQPIDWTAISTAIIATLGMIQLFANKKSDEKLVRFDDKLNTFIDQAGQKFINIFEVVNQFNDNQNKLDVEIALKQIEYDLIGFIDDRKLRTLIEGISTRTRSFSRDVMQHYFDKECYEISKNKVAARSYECESQVIALGYDLKFQQEVNKLRDLHTAVLLGELKQLAEDNQFNDKYARFGDIICRFLKNYSMSIIKIHLVSNGKAN